MKLKYLFTLLAISGFVLHSYAQSNCKQVLYDANKLYEAGKINEAVSSIEACGMKNLTRDEKFETYHLLAISYQALNNETAMDKNIMLMLKLRPNYKNFPNIDPLDFTQVLKKYNVRRLLYLGLESGFNSTGIILEKSYSVFASPQRYVPQKSFQIGILADYRFTHGIAIKLNVSVMGIAINHRIDSANGWSQNYTEQQRYLAVSLSCLKYFKLYKDLKFGVGIGAGFNSLYQAGVNLVSENLQDQTIRMATRDALPERNKTQLSIIPEAGLNYSVGAGYIGLYLSYRRFMNTTVDPNKRLVDENFIFNNQYINDDIKLHSLTLSIAYTRTVLYKTTKGK